MITQRKAGFTPAEWAAIIAASGLPPTYTNSAGEEKPTTESDYLRAALARIPGIGQAFARIGRGGERVGAGAKKQRKRKKQKGSP